MKSIKKYIFSILMVAILMVSVGYKCGLASYADREKVQTLLEEATILAKEKRTAEELNRVADIINELADLAERDDLVKTRLREALEKDSNVHKKLIIAEILAATRDPEVVAILIKLLDESDGAIRAMAISELGLLKASAALKKLEIIANTDPSIKVRLLAENSIDSIKSKN